MGAGSSGLASSQLSGWVTYSVLERTCGWHGFGRCSTCGSTLGMGRLIGVGVVLGALEESVISWGGERRRWVPRWPIRLGPFTKKGSMGWVWGRDKVGFGHGEFEVPEGAPKQSKRDYFSSFFCGCGSSFILSIATCQALFQRASYVITRTSPYHLHFTYGETKTQRGQATEPRPHSLLLYPPDCLCANEEGSLGA